MPKRGALSENPRIEIIMTLNDLNTYAEQGFNRVPVTRRVLADMDTPLSAYLKLAAMPFTYLLESVICYLVYYGFLVSLLQLLGLFGPQSRDYCI